MQANPVIVKELRGRMRGWRAAIVLMIYLLVLSGITLLFYGMLRSTVNSPGSGSAAQIGKFIFSALVIFQAIMVSLLTPAFTAGSITSEREQRTYDLLMTTLLPARSVIFGKLGSALAYVVLLILAIAPLESLCFMLGGVSPEEIVLSQVVMLASALLFASVGIFWSSVLKSSVGSNVLTYGTILFQMIGIPLLYFIIGTTMGAFYSFDPSKPALSSYEPFWYVSGVVLSINPLAAMGMSEALLLKGDPWFIYTTTTLLNGKTLLVVSPWLIFCLESLILSAFLIALSIRNVKPVRYSRQQVGYTYTYAPGTQPEPPHAPPGGQMQGQAAPVSVQEPPQDG